MSKSAVFLRALLDENYPRVGVAYDLTSNAAC